MKRTLIFTIIFTMFLFCNCASKSVHAQQVSLSISPPLLQVITKPGKSVIVAYTLQNLQDPNTATVSIKSFKPKGAYGQIELMDYKGPLLFNLENPRFKLNEAFFLTSKDKQQLLLKITTPDSTSDGDYYYSLLVSTDPSQGISGTTSLARTSIATNILVTVTSDGVTTIKGDVNELSVFPHYRFSFFGNTVHLFESSDIIPVQLIINNSGKNLIKPQGEIKVKGSFGETAHYTIRPENILASSQRLIHADPSEKLECTGSDRYECRQPASFYIKGFFIGKYQLSAQMNFGAGTPTSYGATTFYAFPIKFTIGTISSIIIITTLFLLLKKRKIN